MRWLSGLLLLSIGAVVLAACGQGDLAKSTVTNLPSGDATGSALSGTYRLDATTRSCSGQCPAAYEVGFPVRLCEPAVVGSEMVTATQTEGLLVIDGTRLLYVEQLRGGVWADGHFDVGGYQDQKGVEFTARVEGSWQADGTISAHARLFAFGTVYGVEIDCEGGYDIVGLRH